jgi:RNA polymerase sigma factor (sigma-70 family)
MAELTDGELLERFVDSRETNAEAAFSELMERHGRMVLRVCRQILGNSQDADDAFQATFCVLVYKAASIRDFDSVGSWLLGVARRTAMRSKADAARRRTHERRAAAGSMQELHDNDREAESWAELHEAIARMPERYREPVVLCYLEGLTTEAAASRLGCPKGTVLSRLSRARERLRKDLTWRARGLPASLLTGGFARDAAPAVPTALHDATARTCLEFLRQAATATALPKSAAAALARGVIRAMAIPKFKVFGAAALVSVVGLAGIQTYARQLGGLGSTEYPAIQQEKPAEPRAATIHADEDLKAKLDELTRLNAKLQKEVQALRAEVLDLRSGAAIDPERRARALKADTIRSTPLLPAADPDTIPPADSPSKSGLPQSSMRIHGLIFSVSHSGNTVSMYDPKTRKLSSAKLNAADDHPLNVTPMYTGPVLGLKLKGSRITRIAAFDFYSRSWHTQDLIEPPKGNVLEPTVDRNVVAYDLGRHFYTFTAGTNRWDHYDASIDRDTLDGEQPDQPKPRR